MLFQGYPNLLGDDHQFFIMFKISQNKYSRAAERGYRIPAGKNIF